MRYMLDTCTIIYALKRKGDVLGHLMRCEPKDLCISSITYAELMNGACKSEKKEANILALTLFLSAIEIMPFDDASAQSYGLINSELERKGTPIGRMDALIAGHAKSLDCVLVTDNVREFERVEGLFVEDWA